VNDEVVPTITPGVGANDVTWSRDGDATSATATDAPLAAVGHPVAGVEVVVVVAVAAVTWAVGTLVAPLDPSAFRAVTRTRSVLFWSTDFKT
jgi:hypothetical protein